MRKHKKDLINNNRKTKYHTRKSWFFGTINIRSGKERDEGAKIYTIARELSRQNLSFCCLQEVKYRNSGNKLIELDNGDKYEFHWCGMKKRREAGVGLLIKVDPNIIIGEIEIQDPRVISVNIKIFGFNVRLVNAYSPTEADISVSKKDMFYRLLKKACQKQGKHEKLIVAGDFNAKTSLAYKKSCYDGKNIIPDDDCNDNGTRLKAFCTNHQLCIASTFFEYPNTNRFTWYSCDNKTKRINDYVLTEKYVQEYITGCIAKPDIDFDSDHRILITSLNTPTTRRARRKPNRKQPPIIPFDVKSLENENIKNAFVSSIEEKLKKSHKTSVSPNEISQKITNILNSSAKQCLKRSGSRNNSKDIWKDDIEFNNLISQRQNLHKDDIAYKKLTKAIKKRTTHLRNEKLQREAENINEYASRKQVEDLYRNMKIGNTSFKKLHRKSRCNPVKLKKHFMSHFNLSSNKPIKLEEGEEILKQLRSINDANLNTNRPDLREIRSAIRALKSGKSANDIPPDCIKHAMESKDFSSEMVNLFQDIWKTNEIPNNWGHTKLVALWKGPSKGSQNDPTSYRGLQIGSTLCKILVTIIINRLKDWYERQLMDQQQGFRTGRGTAEGIYIIKRVHQITDHMCKPICALFIDLTAAFDHVNRDLMFEIIQRRLSATSDMKLITLLQLLYSHTTTALSETPEESFKLTSGVRQGGPESPFLFNLFIDFIMRIYLEKCETTGIKFLQLNYKIPSSATYTNKTTIGSHVIDWLGYADDLVLLFEDVDDLERALKLLVTTLKKYQLEINISKTNTMILNHQYTNKPYPQSIVAIDNTPIENVTSFKYLGCIIKYNESSTGDTELETRIDSAHCKFYELRKNLMNFKISLKTRVRVFNALVRCRLTYSCETWNLTKKQTNHIDAVYMSMLRKMVKGGYRRKPESFSYILLNSHILEKCDTDNIHTFIAKQQRNYVTKIIKGENIKLTKRLMFNNNIITKRGRKVTLYQSVIEKERISSETFNCNALSRAVGH